MNRKKSPVMFGLGTATAVLVTCIVFHGLISGLTLFQPSPWLVNSLIAAWAVLFSFLEVSRIAGGRFSLMFSDGSYDRINPDALGVVTRPRPIDIAGTWAERS